VKKESIVEWEGKRGRGEGEGDGEREGGRIGEVCERKRGRSAKGV
jgi:hypothetical protein